ncbi:right-handed parallel beta-helix repeat-containing protein [Micromonospora sp. DT228]|uniref:right-handed parallel beta-helix repeat-containing protein n=1 Tax=Micromonospora sp. DT228 TaxID=3393443 RepID=UPI003CF9A283
MDQISRLSDLIRPAPNAGLSRISPHREDGSHTVGIRGCNPFVAGRGASGGAIPSGNRKGRKALMSNDVTSTDGGASTAPPTRRRRALWVAGVAGLTGVVGLAALGGVAARDDKPASKRASDTQPSTNRQNVSDSAGTKDDGAKKDGAHEGGGRDDDWSGDDWSGVDDRSGRDAKHEEAKHEEKDRGRQVPCDSDRLIQAITFANNEDGGVLELAKGCTYTLTRNQDGNGLPVITENITLKGEHTTIGREATADYFRILNVGPGGHLTLKGLSVRGGQTLQESVTADPATVWAPYSARSVAAGTAPKPAVTTAPAGTPTSPSTAKAAAAAKPAAATAAKPSAAATAAKPSAATAAAKPTAAKPAGTMAAATTAAGTTAAKPTAATPTTGAKASTAAVKAAQADATAVKATEAKATAVKAAEAEAKATEARATAVKATAVKAAGAEAAAPKANAAVTAAKPVAAVATPAPAGSAVVPLVEEPGFNDGAGVLVQPGGRAEILDSELLYNQSGGNGGGLANFGSTRLSKTTVAHNTAFFVGGGIFNAGVLQVDESKIKDNTAIIGGGGISNGAPAIRSEGVVGGSVWVYKSEVTDNETLGFGGGVLDVEGTTTLHQTTVSDNNAVIEGGGIAVADSQLTLKDATVAKNSAARDGGGVFVTSDSVATIENSRIKDNTAGSGGGGLFNEDGVTTLRDSEVVGNRAVGPFARGGGIVNDEGSEVRLHRTTVAHNFATLEPGGIFNSIGGTVTLDDESAVTANRPTNCFNVSDCFA